MFTLFDCNNSSPSCERVMNIPKSTSLAVELHNIDEAFIQPNTYFKDYFTYANKIKYRITVILISIGSALTKGLLKVANKIAWQFKERTGGINAIGSEDKGINYLKWTKIIDVWSIIINHSKRLQLKNINTAFDFMPLPYLWIRKHIDRLKIHLEENSTLPLNEGMDEYSKAFNTIWSFHYSYSYPQYIKKCIPNYAIKDLFSIYKNKLEFKRAGGIVKGLITGHFQQLVPLHQEDLKHYETIIALGILNRRNGSQKPRIRNQNLNKTFKMRQEHLSSRNTTNINDIIEVKCS